MIRLIEAKMKTFERSGQSDSCFIDIAVDFLKRYTDKCHHGKEEDVFSRMRDGVKLYPRHSEIEDKKFLFYLYP
ncbi:MAG: hypothetical protein ABH836_01825 [Candidatus Omnitrophota bacterium]